MLGLGALGTAALGAFYSITTGGVTITPVLGGGGTTTAPALRSLAAGPVLAAGGGLFAGVARSQGVAAHLGGGTAALATLARWLAVAPAVAGGGAVAASLSRTVARTDSERRTRGGDGLDRDRAAGATRLRFANFEAATERTREGG